MLPSVDNLTEGVLLLNLMENRFLTKVKNYICDKELLTKGDNVVVGVSGGADSVALLLSLIALKQEFELKLFVVHINHGIRKEADAEADYVKTLAENAGLPFYLYRFDVLEYAKLHSLGTEEAGRMLRYQAFDEVLGNIGSGKIAVAHNSNDRAETMLFNLVRGTGIKGLASIPSKRDNVIRPLLCVERSEIEAYLEDSGVSFCTDASNFTDDYTRNRIRNNILPVISREVNSGAVAHMANTAEQLEKLNGFVENYSKRVFESLLTEKSADRIVFNKEAFLREDEFIKTTLVKMAIDSLVPGNRDITTRHLESVPELALLEGTRFCDLPYGIKVVSSYETLTFSFDNKDKGISEIHEIIPGESFRFFEEYSVSAELICSEEGFELRDGSGAEGRELSECSASEGFDYLGDECTKCFDYDKLGENPVIRKRMSGDVIANTRSGGTKKLKDYMIDEKIPANIRDGIPVIAVGNRVCWVVGHRMSEAFKVDTNTKRILRIKVFKED